MQAKQEVKKLLEKLDKGEMSGDEPLFVLRARDMLAPKVIFAWIAEAKQFGVNEDKIAEAEKALRDMLIWPEKRKPD